MDNRNMLKLCGLLTGITLCTNVWASENCCFFHPLMTFASGAAFTTHAGQSQTFPEIDSSFYTYSADRSRQTQGLFGGFAGTEFKVHPNWSLQLGLAYYQVEFSGRGTVTQGADLSSSDQFVYHYDMLVQQALVESKLLFNCLNQFHPYFALGLGAAFNRANNYQVNITPSFSTFSPNFADHTQRSFSYSTGVGIDMDVPQHWRFGLGYRFANLGKVKLGQGYIDTVAIPSTLSQSRLYTHEVIAQLTYIFT